MKELIKNVKVAGLFVMKIVSISFFAGFGGALGILAALRWDTLTH